MFVWSWTSNKTYFSALAMPHEIGVVLFYFHISVIHITRQCAISLDVDFPIHFLSCIFSVRVLTWFIPVEWALDLFQRFYEGKACRIFVAMGSINELLNTIRTIEHYILLNLQREINITISWYLTGNQRLQVFSCFFYFFFFLCCHESHLLLQLSEASGFFLFFLLLLLPLLSWVTPSASASVPNQDIPYLQIKKRSCKFKCESNVNVILKYKHEGKENNNYG